MTLVFEYMSQSVSSPAGTRLGAMRASPIVENTPSLPWRAIANWAPGYRPSATWRVTSSDRRSSWRESSPSEDGEADASGIVMISLLSLGSAVLARGKLARVHGLLQELLGIVFPELADLGIRVDHRVLKLAVHPLDLADVDVLDGVAERVHLHRTARRV